jgi:hypothetical protein
MKPYCPQDEWVRRAGLALCSFMPGLTPHQIAEIVTTHLWEEACNLEPEEAAEIYSTDHPE